jgi:hypothetical protein
LTPPCPGIVEAFCIGSCQDLFRGEDWRLGLFFSLKATVAGPQRSNQGETRLTRFPTILRAGRFNLCANPEEFFSFPVCREICTVCRDSERPAKKHKIKYIQWFRKDFP